jgi:hypothetical protein
MPHDRLGSYVRDHLTRTRGALALLRYLQDQAVDPAIRTIAASFQLELESDREVLERLSRELGVSTADARTPLSEAEAPDLPGEDDTARQLEALERLALGLLDKVALWDVLIAMTARDPALPRLDYRGLRSRAREQHRRINSHRLRFAQRMLLAG